MICLMSNPTFNVKRFLTETRRTRYTVSLHNVNYELLADKNFCDVRDYLLKKYPEFNDARIDFNIKHHFENRAITLFRPNVVRGLYDFGVVSYGPMSRWSLLFLNRNEDKKKTLLFLKDIIRCFQLKVILEGEDNG